MANLAKDPKMTLHNACYDAYNRRIVLMHNVPDALCQHICRNLWVNQPDQDVCHCEMPTNSVPSSTLQDDVAHPHLRGTDCRQGGHVHAAEPGDLPAVPGRGR